MQIKGWHDSFFNNRSFQVYPMASINMYFKLDIDEMQHDITSTVINLSFHLWRLIDFNNVISWSQYACRHISTWNVLYPTSCWLKIWFMNNIYSIACHKHHRNRGCIGYVSSYISKFQSNCALFTSVQSKTRAPPPLLKFFQSPSSDHRKWQLTSVFTRKSLVAFVSGLYVLDLRATKNDEKVLDLIILKLCC